MPKTLLFAAGLILFLSLSDCRGKNNKPAEIHVKTDETPTIEHVKIYLENSGSMGGYFRYKTAFNQHLDDLVVDVGSKFDSVSAFTISEHIEAFEDIKRFREELNPTNPTKIAIGKSSPLDSIFHKIGSAWQPNEISVLLTDGIISGTNEQIVRYTQGAYNIDHLNIIKNNIKLTFNQFKATFAVQVFGYISEFHATRETPYFTLDNTPLVNLDFPNRPYYLVIFGTPAQLRSFEESCSYCHNEFRLEFGLPDNVPVTVTSVGKRSGILVERDELIFQKDMSEQTIPLLLDMNMIPDGFKTKEFLAENAEVSINGKKIDSVKFTVDDLALREFDRINRPESEASIRSLKGFTHLISITLSNYTYLPGDSIVFVINKDNGTWHETWSSADDREIQPDDSTTFGLSTLIQGIQEAYGNSPLIHYAFKIKTN